MTVFQTISVRAAVCCPDLSPEPSLMASTAHGAEENLSLQDTTVYYDLNVYFVSSSSVQSVMLACEVYTVGRGMCLFSSVRCSQRERYRVTECTGLIWTHPQRGSKPSTQRLQQDTNHGAASRHVFFFSI